jgi:hypothetical protein
MDEAEPRIRRIAAHLPLTRLLRPTLEFALYLAKGLGAELDVILSTNGKSGRKEVSALLDGKPRLSPTALRRLDERLGELVSSNEDRPLLSSLPDVRLHAMNACTTDRLLAFIMEHEADLIVTDASGLSPDSPLQRKAEAIARKAPCPVVSVNACGEMFRENRRRAHRRESTHSPGEPVAASP